jgi:hypothetical protein
MNMQMEAGDLIVRSAKLDRDNGFPMGKGGLKGFGSM